MYRVLVLLFFFALACLPQLEAQGDLVNSKKLDECRAYILSYGQQAKSPNQMSAAPASQRVQRVEKLDEELLADAFLVVTKKVKCRLNHNQTLALVSLVYTIGSGYFKDSDLFRFLNDCKLKRDKDLVQAEILKWTYATNSINDLWYQRRLKESNDFYAKAKK